MNEQQQAIRDVVGRIMCLNHTPDIDYAFVANTLWDTLTKDHRYSATELSKTRARDRAIELSEIVLDVYQTLCNVPIRGFDFIAEIEKHGVHSHSEHNAIRKCVSRLTYKLLRGSIYEPEESDLPPARRR